jgi:hypothetical protein
LTHTSAQFEADSSDASSALLSVPTRWWLWPALMLIAASGAVLLLIATPWGIGLTPDSMMYVGSARGILVGQGVAMRIEADRYNPLVSYAPGFSVLLAGLSKLGLGDPIDAARPAQAALFAANLLLIAWVVRATTHSAWAALWAGTFLLLTPHFVRVHAYALAEPLFITCVIGGIALVGSYLQSGTRWHLAAAGACLVLSFLARYAGLAFMGAAVVAVLLWSKGSRRQRLIRSAVLAAALGVPVVLWMWRNALVGHSAGRPLAWHPISAKHWLAGWTTLRQWIAPEGLVAHFAAEIALVGAGAGVVWFVCTLKPYESQSASTGEARRPIPHFAARVAALAAAMYLGFLVVSISLFDFDTSLNFRILAPALACGVIAAAGAAAALATRHGAWRLGAMMIAMALLPLHAYAGAREYVSLRQVGAGYASPQWKNHPLLDAVRQVPHGVTLYTNAPDVLFLLVDRNSICFPSKRSLITLRANPEYPRQMREVAQALRSGNAVIVFFHGLTEKRPTLPLEKELLAEMSLQPTHQVRGGRMYRWSDSAATKPND